jgi:MFS family permease
MKKGEDYSKLKVSKVRIAQLKEKTRKLSIIEASFYSIMDGFGLRYVTPFALAVGATNFTISLLSAIPSLLGNLSQLKTFGYMEKYSRKKIVFFSVLLQSFMWLFLLLAGSMFFIFGIKNQLSSLSIVLVYTLLIFFGAFGGPAWTSLMADIVDSSKRGSYFGIRSRIAGIVSLICLLIAGFILDFFKKTNLFLAFSVIFLIAFLGRFVCAILFLKHYEPKFIAKQRYFFTLFQFIRRMKDNNFGKFVIFFSILYFSTAIASPFFSVYMLKDLNFSYVFYMAVVLSPSVFSFIFMPAWGKFVDKYGSLIVMKITGFFIPVIPILWLLTFFFEYHSYGILFYLIVVEAMTGFVWAGFNLAAGNFIYDAVSKERLALCTSYFSILSGVGAVIGSLFGGFLASINLESYNIVSPLLLVFSISALMRFFAYKFFVYSIKEVRFVQEITFGSAFKKFKELSFHKVLSYLGLEFFLFDRAKPFKFE